MALEHVSASSIEIPHRARAGAGPLPDHQSIAVRAHGYSLRTDLSGDPQSPPVMLLHGIPGWRGTWRPVARLLSRSAYVVAPDLAGFGESSAAPPRFHAVDQAALILALMDALGLRAVHLVGFDYGGPIAVLVHALASERVATLTLAAANVLTDTPIPLPLQLVRPPIVGDAFARLFFGRLGLTLMWCAAVSRRDRFPLAEYRALLRFSKGVVSTRRVFQASLRDLPGLYGPVRDALAGIRVPCRVVWGDRDPFFPVAVGEQTAALIPGAAFVLLERCGHFLPVEDPGGLAKVVERLVAAPASATAHGVVSR